MLNDLLLLSGNDIPFESAQLIIHQPTIKEIAYIGEEAFFEGCDFLKFSKDRIKEEDKIHLEKLTNFDILMSITLMKDAELQKKKTYMLMVLSLIFPQYTITLTQTDIILKDVEQNEFKINNSNFQDFKNIFDAMFCLNMADEESGDYNPQDPLAERIAKKLKTRHEKLNALHQGEEQKKIAILSRYVSILAVGQKKDMNSLLNYTLYQLFDEFYRYELKVSYDIYLQAKMAGAKDLKEVEDWMKDIHP